MAVVPNNVYRFTTAQGTVDGRCVRQNRAHPDYYAFTVVGQNFDRRTEFLYIIEPPNPPSIQFLPQGILIPITGIVPIIQDTEDHSVRSSMSYSTANIVFDQDHPMPYQNQLHNAASVYDDDEDDPTHRMPGYVAYDLRNQNRNSTAARIADGGRRRTRQKKKKNKRRRSRYR